MNTSYLQKTLNTLKDTFKKCLDRRKALSKSDASASSLPECKYFRQMAFLHEKSANVPTVSNVVPNASEETTEFGLTSQRNSITAITSNVEPCQSSIPNSSASASHHLLMSANENLTKSNSELNTKDDLLFSFVPGKRVCTSQKRKALRPTSIVIILSSDLKDWSLELSLSESHMVALVAA